MRVLVVGGGGREHALCWALAGSPAADEAVVRPGQCRASPRWRSACRSAPRTSPALVAFARENAVDLVVAGPEAPLTPASPMHGRGRHALLRAERRRGAAGGQQDLHQGGRRRRRHADRRLGAVRRRRRRARLFRAAGRADRGEGGWPGRRQGRGGGATTEARPRPPSTTSWRTGCIGAAGAAVVIEECLVGEEVSLLRPLRRRDRPAARRGAGPQAGRRRRHRAEHRRHGRLFARRRSSPRRCSEQVMDADHPARRWPRWRGAARRSAACCSPG